MAAVTTTGTSTGIFDVWLSDKHWSGSTLTYSFPNDGSTYNYLSTGLVTPLSASQQDGARKALGEISSFTQLNFVEVVESASNKGDLRFGTDARESGAYAYLPTASERGGDSFYGPIAADPQIGNESYLIFIHEIGHTMGLLHGHEYKSFRDSGYDSSEFTVVTYTDYVGDTNPSFDAGPIDWAQSFMQLDIAAMQFLYGANYAPSGEVWSGDTIYTFDETSGEMSINGAGQGVPAGNRIFRTIWDGDGTDTYDLSNYSQGVTISLAEGAWSTFSTGQLADLDRLDPGTELARGNVANALMVDGDTRALIENAIASQYDDTLYGNQVANRLQGNGGNDIVYGEAGRDKLLGNAGDDRLYGGDGKDRIIGGSGKDQLFGESGADRLIGGAGKDLLVGDNGRDVLLGGAGRDVLGGGRGNDVLRGGKGGDTIQGGLGQDIMTGGGGADRFYFASVDDSASGKKADVIRDFTSGTDKLDLADLATVPLTLDLNGSFSGTGPSVITRMVGNETRVLVDGDGDGIADFRIDLIGVSTLVVDDFIF